MQIQPQEIFARLQAKGLITIPKKFRKEIGLEKNSLICVKKQKNRLILEPVKTIAYPLRTYTKKEIETFLAFDAQQTKELKTIK